MRVVRSDRCIAKLARGEVRRTPRVLSHPPAGYYVGCPSCGRVAPILSAAIGGQQVFDESSGKLTMTPSYECARCLSRFSIVQDEIQIHAP